MESTTNFEGTTNFERDDAYTSKVKTEVQDQTPEDTKMDESSQTKQ